MEEVGEVVYAVRHELAKGLFHYGCVEDEEGEGEETMERGRAVGG